MKHLTLLPFLIAAALLAPRAHAASYAAIDTEPATYTIALVCLLLIVLANCGPRRDIFRQPSNDN